MDLNIVRLKLETPSTFSFPFEPYEIQNNFMKELFTVLEEGKLGIFESPTGTGKSLSIICSVLKWLKDHEIRERNELELTVELLKKEKDNLTESEGDWLTSQSKEIDLNKKLQDLQLEINKIKKNDELIAKLKNSKQEKNLKKESIKDSFKQFREKENKNPDSSYREDDDNDDADLEFLLEEHTDEDSSEEEQTDEQEYEGVKVFICSRTHSQISQLVQEVKRSPYSTDIRLVTLASRQNYCINPQVNKFKNSVLINEKCLDLQRSSESKTTNKSTEGNIVKKKRINCRCPYLQNKMLDELKDSVLLEIQDMEEIVSRGKKLNACPYYAARSVINNAQLILLPYQMILHKSTREASGIKLKNNIIIIDEAHNIMEALADMYSAQVTGHQLLLACNHLTEYRNKYRNKFTTQNLLYLNQLTFIFGNLIKMLGGKPGCSFNEKCSEVQSTLYTLTDFLATADFDHLNIFKLLKFSHKSKLSQKLNGFAMKYQSTVNINDTKKPIETKGIKAFLETISTTNNKLQQIQQPILTEKGLTAEETPRNPFLIVLSFLEALAHKYEDGRVICNKKNTVSQGSLKFLLLNSSTHFDDIVAEARSILVVGGTMQPMSEFKKRLFISSGASQERIVEFSCEHIVPAENILAVALLNGPTMHSLDFSYTNRNNNDTLNELGRILCNVCSVVPGGIVCFFPSYDYEKLVHDYLEKSNILHQLSVNKQIFREPKLSSDVDKILTLYAKTIKSCMAPRTGAIMFSVVGGKLSEGLNFSDDLGRCVIVVGLPYPNIKSLELQEKLSYLNKNEDPCAGNIFYENLCMKAVNQCIGRAVRHRNDYATILLLDQRYSRPKTQNALPSWIQRSLITCDKFGPAFAAVSKFFSSRKVKC